MPQVPSITDWMYTEFQAPLNLVPVWNGKILENPGLIFGRVALFLTRDKSPNLMGNGYRRIMGEFGKTGRSY